MCIENNKITILEPNSKNLDVILKNILCKIRTVLAFVGTELRCDDRFGLLLYSILERELDFEGLILCEYGLENCVGEIERHAPLNLVIFDGVVVDAPPGYIVISSLESLEERFLTTTHNIPLSLTIKYLRSKGLVKDVTVIGVRVFSLDIGEEVSPIVEKTTRILADKIIMVLKNCMKKDVLGS